MNGLTSTSSYEADFDFDLASGWGPLATAFLTHLFAARKYIKSSGAVLN